jgi:hypothetical protein
VGGLLEQSHLTVAMTCHYGRGSTLKVTDNNNTESDSNKATENSNNFFQNLAGYNDIESFTIGGLIDDVYLSLLCSKETVTDDYGTRIVINKYYLQAWKLQRFISVGYPPPYFVIMLSDLNPKLKQALKDLDDETKNYVLNQAIGRIFENINPKLYHLSIARRLRWKLESEQKR